MIKLLIIFIFTITKSFGQDYVAKWKTVGKEVGVINYQVQKSSDSLGAYTTIPGATIQPKKLKDSNLYAYTIPQNQIPPAATGRFYRIKALLSNATVYTIPQKKINTNVSITDAILKINTQSDNLTFTATNQGKVDSFYIERSNSTSSWGIVGKIPANKPTGKYVLNVSKTGINRKYRVKATYKSGIVSPYTNFN